MITVVVTSTQHDVIYASKQDNRTLVRAYELHDPKYKLVMEFGVYRGGTLNLLRNLFANPSYVVYGFDSFEGLPEAWVGTGLPKGGFDMKREIPAVTDSNVIPGWFSYTIPLFKLLIPPQMGICLLHVDSDLYSSCREVLYGLNAYIKPGTIIVFDEWTYHLKTDADGVSSGTDGEQKCFYEWAEENKRKFELFPRIEEERQIVRILE